MAILMPFNVSLHPILCFDHTRFLRVDSLPDRSLQPRGLAETLCGSPLYMAPEIMQLQKYDAKVIFIFYCVDSISAYSPVCFNLRSKNRRIYGVLVQYYFNWLPGKHHSLELTRYRSDCLSCTFFNVFLQLHLLSILFYNNWTYFFNQLLQNIIKSNDLHFPPDNNLSNECIDLCRKLLRRNPGMLLSRVICFD